MTVKGIECLSCGDKIWSRFTHDFRRCMCEGMFVDGGREYLRYGNNPGVEFKVIDIEVPDAKDRD